VWQAFGKKIVRRVYNVGGVDWLWHVDGMHKLIRYGLIVHACIDGFSRYVVWCKLSTNNRATTQLAYLKKAVRDLGNWPSRMRSDCGGENVLMADAMIVARGLGRASHIFGKSTGNQRIERHWRDLRRKVWILCAPDYFLLFHTRTHTHSHTSVVLHRALLLHPVHPVLDVVPQEPGEGARPGRRRRPPPLRVAAPARPAHAGVCVRVCVHVPSFLLTLFVPTRAPRLLSPVAPTPSLHTQQELNEHQAAWNNHKLSTEGSKTPTQLRTLHRDTAKAPPDAVDEDEYGAEDLDEDADPGEDDADGLSVVNLEPRVNPLSDAGYDVFCEEAPPVPRNMLRPDIRAAFIDALVVLNLLLQLAAEEEAEVEVEG